MDPSSRAPMPTILILVLLATSSAGAVRVDVPSRPVFEPVNSPRKAKVLRTARAAFNLTDGSQWIVHRVPAQREPSAFGVTRFGPDGSARVFLVSDWLPKGSIPRGWCGQVYAVTLLTDGRVAVSAGWTDGRDSHNGIFILRARPDGPYDTDKVIEVPGVSQIVGAGRNTILAVTDDASLRGGGPLLTLFDTQGHKLAHLLDSHELLSPSEAARNAMAVRLQRIAERIFALYDPASQLVSEFDMEVLADEVIVSGRRNIFVGDDASTADLPVLGIDASDDGVLVVRVGLIRGTPGTHLTIYGSDGLAKQSTTLDRPWNLMFREEGRVRGVVLREDVALDTIPLRREH